MNETTKTTSFSYYIRNGEKRPSKRTVIKVAFALKATVEETNLLLKSSGNKELYPRQEEDSIIEFGLRNHLDVYQFIDLYNKTKATFSGLDRIDTRDYPEEAVREALLNSIVHRDYSFSGSNLINIYEDRIEFVSLGGLVSGLELKSIFLGVSQTRNPNLAALFYRMSLIECYGTGITKIQRVYRQCRKKPVFETAQGVFRVTLPNRNEFETDTENRKTEINSIVYMDQIKKESSKPETGRRRKTLELQKKRIIEYAIQNGKITRKETEELLGVGTTKAFRLLKELCEEGKLKAQGTGRLSSYALR